MKERVLIVVIEFERPDMTWSTEESLWELRELVNACGGEVIDSMTCSIKDPKASTILRQGRLEELTEACQFHEINTAIFNCDLKGSQQRNLEEILGVKTIDRTQLILDIFARHASSQEGKMQVELAQLEYLLPRLVGQGVALSRLGGGIGTLGPGETKLEVDRRRIGQRISKLKKALEDISDNRTVKRKKRRDQGIPLVSLVGYTNAGKSTLLNTLTQAGQTTRDGLFTTLDPLSRQLILPNNQKIVLSDTVGFMHELPHRLIESFKATLEEVRQADILVHVLDISRENFRHLHASVQDVLKELEAFDKPTITVFNKIDQITDKSWLKDLEQSFDNGICLSAKTEENIPALLEKMISMLSASLVELDVDVHLGRMDLVHLAHKEGQVYSVKYYGDRIHLRALLPRRISGYFLKE